MALGTGGLLVVLETAEQVTTWAMSPALVVAGVGMGAVMAPFFDIVLAGVEQQETGSASGALTAVQQLGGAFGVALLGTVFFQFEADFAAGTGVAAAIRTTLWVVLGLLAVTFAAVYLLPRRARPAAEQP